MNPAVLHPKRGGGEGERLLKLSKLSNSKQLTNGFIKQLDCTSINIKIENFFC